MLLGKDSELLKTIVEEGDCFRTIDDIYYSKKTDSYSRAVKQIYSFRGKEHYVIKKSTDTYTNSFEEQIQILIEGQKMGFYVPTTYVNENNEWYMFDITENEKHHLIDMGVSGVMRRLSQLNEEGNGWYITIGSKKISFKDLSNFDELVSETPAKMARFRKFYLEGTNDPFMWLIKNNMGLLYFSDVEDVKREKPEILYEPKQSSYKNISSALNSEDKALDDRVLNIISKKPEIQSKMKKIFLEEFKKSI